MPYSTRQPPKKRHGAASTCLTRIAYHQARPVTFAALIPCCCSTAGGQEERQGYRVVPYDTFRRSRPMRAPDSADLRLVFDMARSFIGTIPSIVWVAVGGFAYMLAQLYRNQNAMLYYPVVPGAPFKRPRDNPAPYDSPASLGLLHEDVRVATSDGETLHAWWCFSAQRADEGIRPTIVFFHANAGNMGFRLPNVQLFVERLGANVLIFDYRGYGESTGTPTEAGLERDADVSLLFSRGFFWLL